MITNTEEYYNRLNSIFHGIVAIPLLVYGWMFLQSEQNEPILMTISNTRLVIIVFSVIILAVIIYLFWIRKNFIDDLKQIQGTEDGFTLKMDRYFNLSVKTYFLISIPSVIGLIGFVITFFHGFTVIYLLGLFTLSFYRPSTLNICENLKLKGKERDIILQKKPFPVNEEG